jgi:TonB family protein
MIACNKIILMVLLLLSISTISFAEKTKQNKVKNLTNVYAEMGYLPPNDTIMPKFVYGEDSLMKFIAKSVKYPAKAKEQSIKGTVYVSFIVDAEGNITDTKVLKGIGGGCDEESIRVINSMPKWKPAEMNGKKIPARLFIPIRFVLATPSPANQDKK